MQQARLTVSARGQLTQDCARMPVLTPHASRPLDFLNSIATICTHLNRRLHASRIEHSAHDRLARNVPRAESSSTCAPACSLRHAVVIHHKEDLSHPDSQSACLHPNQSLPPASSSSCCRRSAAHGAHHRRPALRFSLGRHHRAGIFRDPAP